MTLESKIEQWDGQAVVCRRDEDSGTWMFVAIHDTTLGPACGGTRMRAYPNPSAALEDAMGLAQGMTEKWAVLDLPFGGGKAVLAPDRPLEGDARDDLLRRYGGVVETMNGGFLTGEDLGTSPRDMAVVAQASRYVHGVDYENGSTMDPGPYTARGVLRAIEAALEATFGSSDPEGRSVLIQGVGDVGAPLARLLREAGARILVSDVDAERASAVAREVDGTTVDPAAALATSADVFAPCAIGGILSEESAAGLAARIVTGSANTQLATPRAAEVLHGRGILYAPDFVANGGGAAAFGLRALGGDEEAMIAKVDAIGDTMREILSEAALADESPLAAARRIVSRRLAARREVAFS